MKALIIPSISSANYLKSCIKEYQDYIFCTDSPSVKVYCKINLKINCHDINDYFTGDLRNKALPKLLKKYLRTLEDIDTELSLNLDKDNNKIVKNWVFHLYRYSPFFYYFGLFNFKNSLSNFLLSKKIKSLLVINDFQSYYLYFNNTHVQKIIKSFKNLKVKFIYLKKKTILNELNLTSIKVKIKNLVKIFINFLHIWKFYFFKFINYKKKNIIVFQPTYDIDFLKYKNDNIYYKSEYSINLFKKLFAEKKYLNKVTNIFKNPSKEIEFKIIIDLIRDDFQKNFNRYLNFIKSFRNFIRTNKISKGIWGLPSIHPNEKVLMIKHMMDNKVNVTGTQHGGCYFDMDQDTLHALSDYIYCDEFTCFKKIKLNLNKNILKNLKNSKMISNGFNRVKKLKKSEKYLKKSEKNILIPLTNWNDNFVHNMGPTSSEILKRQEFIFENLDKNNLPTVIKLIANTNQKYNETHYPAYYLAEKYKNKNFKYERNLNLQDSINLYKPDLLILETVSTPLYESIINDCDIVCFDNKTNKLKKNIKSILSKRIYFVDNNNDLLKLINKYKKGNLKKKRDNTFLYEHLLNR